MALTTLSLLVLRLRVDILLLPLCAFTACYREDFPLYNFLSKDQLFMFLKKVSEQRLRSVGVAVRRHKTDKYSVRKTCDV